MTPSTATADAALQPSRLRLGLAILLELFSTIAHAAPDRALPEIDWQLYGLPPLYILEGQAQGLGVLDRGLRVQVLPRLTGYRHRTTEVPIKRLESTLRSQPNACAFGLFKNASREAYMVFSKPFLSQIPPGVIVLRSGMERLKPFLDARGQLKLRSALESNELSLGYADSRSYGAAVDGLLAELRGHAKLQAVSATTPARNLMQMTQLGRLDLALMLPYEPRHLEITEGLDVKNLRFLRVAEQPRELQGYAACAKGPLGEAVIQRLNEVLARADVQAALYGYYEQWLDDDSKALARQLRAPP